MLRSDLLSNPRFHRENAARNASIQYRANPPIKFPISLGEILLGRGAFPDRIGSRRNSAITTTMIIAMIFIFYSPFSSYSYVL